MYILLISIFCTIHPLRDVINLKLPPACNRVCNLDIPLRCQSGTLKFRLISNFLNSKNTVLRTVYIINNNSLFVVDFILFYAELLLQNTICNQLYIIPIMNALRNFEKKNQFSLAPITYLLRVVTSDMQYERAACVHTNIVRIEKQKNYTLSTCNSDKNTRRRI